jgi:hypothetical protein
MLSNFILKAGSSLPQMIWAGKCRAQSGLDAMLKGRDPFEAPQDLEERSSAICSQEKLTIRLGLCLSEDIVIAAIKFCRTVSDTDSQNPCVHLSRLSKLREHCRAISERGYRVTFVRRDARDE